MTQDATTEMARYIWKLILSSGPIAMSWGIDPLSLRQIPNGLRFHVQGLKLKGRVSITYDEATDYFNVTTEPDAAPAQRKTIEGISFDELSEVIDREVEYTGPDYRSRLLKEYGTP